MKRRGSILVTTLWIIALLSLLAASTIASVRLRTREATWRTREVESRLLLQQAAQLAMQRLASDQELEIDHYGERWGQTIRITSQDLGLAISKADNGQEEFVLTIQPIDDSGKVNLNHATEAMTISVLKELGVLHDGAMIAEAIIDWRDLDSIGAYETNAYHTTLAAYATPNADFLRTEDLLLTKGVSPSLYWGEDRNSNGNLDPNEDDGEAHLPYDNNDGRLNKGLCDVFAARSEPEVNVNTATEEVIRGLLSASQTPIEQVEAITRLIQKYRVGPDGLRNTKDDQGLGTMDALLELLGDKGSGDLNLLPIGFHSEQFRFILQIQYNDPYYIRSASLVVGRDSSGELVVREWVRQ